MDPTGSERAVVLEGADDSLPADHADAEPVLTGSQVVVTRRGQYQHFERSGGTEYVDGQLLPVFRWSYSTAIAE
ncbi:DUF5988 family protein [Kitasatospora sp. NPDC052868]|uniref:DUF5988 family protein n=1 Tax=Kitasatospora sp. NPDC052868 TaxID=3364060 RepID=UPI0037C8867A